MDDQTKASFERAADTSKQLIALATGLIAIEITFAKGVMGSVDGVSKLLVGGSWIFFLLSVFAGVWTQLALTGSLGQKTAPTAESIFANSIRRPALAQILLFLVALVLTVCFGVRGVL